MSSPNAKFNSGAVPHGSIFVDIFRPTDPENPNSGATKLGTYRLESLAPKRGSHLVKRPDIDAGPNGWFIIGEDTEGSAVIQRNTAGTPTVEAGDYFDAAFGMGADGVTAIQGRFVIHGPDLAMDSGYRKQSVSVIVDSFATGVAPRNPLNGN